MLRSCKTLPPQGLPSERALRPRIGLDGSELALRPHRRRAVVRLGEQTRDESLPFGHTLDLDRDGFHSLLETLESAARLGDDGLRRRRSLSPPPPSSKQGVDENEPQRREASGEESFLEVIASPAGVAFLPRFGDQLLGRRGELPACRCDVGFELNDPLVENADAFLETGAACSRRRERNLLGKFASARRRATAARG